MSAIRSIQPADNGGLDKDLEDDNDLTFSTSDEGENSSDQSEEQRQEDTKDHTKCSSKQNNLQNFRFRFQKNLIGRIQTRQSIRPLIGRRGSVSLKCFEDLAKHHITKQSERKIFLQYIIKTLGKFGIIAKSGSHCEATLKNAQILKQRVRALAKTVISYTRTQQMYNRNYLICQLSDCQDTLHQCVDGLVSNDSIDRINYIFTVLKSDKLLDSVFSASATKAQRDALVKFTDSLESALKLSTQSATTEASK